MWEGPASTTSCPRGDQCGTKDYSVGQNVCFPQAGVRCNIGGRGQTTTCAAVNSSHETRTLCAARNALAFAYRWERSFAPRPVTVVAGSNAIPHIEPAHCQSSVASQLGLGPRHSRAAHWIRLLLLSAAMPLVRSYATRAAAFAWPRAAASRNKRSASFLSFVTPAPSS